MDLCRPLERVDAILVLTIAEAKWRDADISQSESERGWWMNAASQALWEPLCALANVTAPHKVGWMYQSLLLILKFERNFKKAQPLIKYSCSCCHKFYVAEKRLSLTGKFDYFCKLTEKGNSAERRKAPYVDNLQLIDCHCSAVSVIYSVTQFYGSIWERYVIVTIMHPVNWARLSYFSLNWQTNAKQDGNCKVWS